MELEILDKDVRLFQGLISRKSGISLEDSRLDTLRAGLYTEMESKGFADPSQYYNFLRFHPDGAAELEQLLTYVTINETYFFRNPAHFNALRDHVLFRLSREKKDGVIKVWSAGCSTGEEPYSIAIAFLDLFEDRPNLKIEIVGTDVDRTALEKARRGFYRNRALRVTEDRHKKRYFEETSGGFEISEQLKQIVRFEHFNLMETPYLKPSKAHWDIIFCRNVVIYFDRRSVHHVVNNLCSVLSDDGYLFMGHAESLDGISDDLSLTEVGETFIYTKKSRSGDVSFSASSSQPLPRLEEREGREPSDDISPLQRDRGAPSGAVSTRRRRFVELDVKEDVAAPEKQVPPVKDLESMYQESLELFRQEQYDAALSAVEMYTEHKPDDARGHLLSAKIYADWGIYKRAASGFETAVSLDPLLIEAHYLLGIVYQELGQVSKAIEEFRKSIYIDKDRALPYFSLARAYQSIDMSDNALREYSNALRIMKRMEEDEVLQFSGGMTARLLAQVCVKNIEELSG